MLPSTGMQHEDSPYAHVDQPAFEQMQIDHNISRVAIFFVCFLTIGVFYFTLVACPVVKLLPLQQIQQLGQIGNLLNPNSGNRTGASGSPVGALGGSQISGSGAASAGASAAPSAAPPSAASSPAASAPAAPSAAASIEPSSPASSSASASPSVGASGGSYTVQAGDTLSSIARKFNTTVRAIADANNVPNSGLLKVGEKLTIPAQ